LNNDFAILATNSDSKMISNVKANVSINQFYVKTGNAKGILSSSTFFQIDAYLFNWLAS
jgi:hypothetical protein